jgi:hypothetical protein
MARKNFWIAVIVGGIVVNIMDMIVQGMLFQSMFYKNMEGMRMDVNPGWYVLLDFVTVIVFVWFYDRVYNSFEGGVRGAMKYGVLYGIVTTFPMMFFPHLMYAGFPYALVWASIVYGIIWGGVLGTVVGKFYTKGEASQATA